MKRRSDPDPDWQSIRDRIVGLGDHSVKKSYYPQLQKRLEELERFRILLNRANEAIFLVQVPSGLLVDVNESACRLLGLEREDLLRRSLTELIVQPLPLELARVFFSPDPGGEPLKAVHAVMNTRGGPGVPVEMSVQVMRLSDGVYAVGVARDIRERIQAEVENEKLQNQLMQAQKMESIGVLASGLGHDLNNLLGGISGPISLLKFKLNEDGVVEPGLLRKYLDIVEESGQRAAELMQQLLSFSRQQTVALAPVDLNKTLANVMKICRNSFDKCIELHPLGSPQPALVMADSIRMEQVLLNLCINAAHAMTSMRGDNAPQGGELTVSIEKIRLDRYFRETRENVVEGEYWRIAVIDTGIGMDRGTIGRIFDPFFTTKGKGQGTGLGLSIAYSVIQQHKGFIDVYSEPGEGTVFHVYMPVCSGEMAAVGPMRRVEIPHGEGLILVVDDEEAIRQIARAILEECGYQVILAENGEEAVRIFHQRSREIAAVLLDMVMPKKSGKETFLELQGIDPAVKVLLSSGFKNDEQVRAISRLGVRGFIQKPYTFEQLSLAMAGVIASTGPEPE